MSDLLYVALGALISIPIGIFSPFVTEHVRQRLGERDRVQSKKRREQLEAELAQTEIWHHQPERFSSFLLGRILLITLASAFATIVPNLSTVLYIAFRTLGGLDFPYYEVFSGLGSLISVALTAVVAQLCARTLRIFRRVHNFEAYESHTRKQLSSLASQNGQATTVERQ